MSTADQIHPRRMGRPPKPAEDRKSATMRFRTREGLREQLEAAAEISGRSPSEEAEIRLQNSFKLEPLHQMVFGNGTDARRLVTLILTAIRTIQEYENPNVALGLATDDWRGDAPESDLTRAALRNALTVIVGQALPPPRTPDQVPLSDEQRQIYAQALNHMKGFGIEFAKLVTGQRPDLAEALDTGGAPEH